VLAVGLTVFLLLAGTGGGEDRATTTAWLVCAAVAVPVLGICIAVAARSVGTRRAVLFAFTAGALFGLTAALTKSSVVLIGNHGFAALTYWEPYALAVLGGLGFVINQRAFQAGSLTASLPTLTIVEPVVAAVVGVTMLDETVPTRGVLGWVAIAMSVAAMMVGTIALSRSAARHESFHPHELADIATRVDREN
jgi:hypothetical protein